MGKAIDLTGQRFGKLTAIEMTGTDKDRSRLWKCRCDCGEYKEYPAARLRAGKVTSCGCRMPKNIDLRGQRFGKLTAIEKIGQGKHRESIWRCVCDCGKYREARLGDLRKGNVVRCGPGCPLPRGDNKYWIEHLDLTGRKYGYLTVVGRAETDKHGNRLWLCRCACGKYVKYKKYYLEGTKNPSCGCRRDIREGRDYLLEPLNDGERDFVEKHYGTVFAYFKYSGYSFDRYYDVVILPYIRICRRYLREEKLQQYSISTLVYGICRREIQRELKKEAHRVKTISWETPLYNTDKLKIKDII